MKIRRIVMEFAEAMERKLEANGHKDFGPENQIGEDCSNSFLVEGLMCEVAELVDAVYDPEGIYDSDDVLNEAADVANFALMLANRACTSMTLGVDLMASDDNSDQIEALETQLREINKVGDWQDHVER